MLEVKRLPLKIDIHADIDAALRTPSELSNALRVYVSAAGYLEHKRTGAMRIDLNGAPAGTVTIEAAHKAAEQLANKMLKAAARRKARKAVERPAAAVSAGGSVSVRPKRLGLADLKRHALARKGDD